jgi:hypothetical protein
MRKNSHPTSLLTYKIILKTGKKEDRPQTTNLLQIQNSQYQDNNQYTKYLVFCKKLQFNRMKILPK